MSLNAKYNPLESVRGQRISDQSVPVVIASDQTPIPVTLTLEPVIDIGKVDQGLPNTVPNAWPVLTVPGSAGSLQLVTATYGALAVSTTPVALQVGVSPLANRIIVTAIPLNGQIYMGFDNAVTSTTGTPIPLGAIMTLDATDALTVWLVAASGTVDTRITEGSDL